MTQYPLFEEILKKHGFYSLTSKIEQLGFFDSNFVQIVKVEENRLWIKLTILPTHNSFDSDEISFKIQLVENGHSTIDGINNHILLLENRLSKKEKYYSKIMKSVIREFDEGGLESFDEIHPRVSDIKREKLIDMILSD